MTVYQAVRLASLLGGGPRQDVAVRIKPGEPPVRPPLTPIGSSMLAAYGRAETIDVFSPPDPYVFTFKDAVVQSASGIVALGNGEVIEDTLDHTDPDIDGYRRVGSHEVRGSDNRPRAEGGVVHLSSISGHLRGKHLSLLLGGVQNFYHWVVMNLGRLSVLQPSDLNDLDSILVPYAQDRFQTESLASFELSSLAPLRPVRFGEALSVEQLLVPWHVASENGVRGEAVQCLRAMVPVKQSSGDELYGRAIYVDRRKSLTRPLANETELVAALQRHGVEPVFLEDISFEQQMLCFQDAEIIIGPHGAGLANMVFARPGTRVLEIVALESLNPCYRNLSFACGHHYDFVVGRRMVDHASHHLAADTWVVSITHVLAALDLYEHSSGIELGQRAHPSRNSGRG